MEVPSRQDAPVVPVQLTTITPVRVFNVHGEFFDTEIDVDAPLKPLQLAIEDFFLVKAEVQLLLHNRQQIDPQRSLRQNGCLMLKGDPYVKLVFAVKRGTLLNVVCHVRGGQQARGGFSFPVACDESATVWQTKQVIAQELFRRQRGLDSSTPATTDEVPLNPHRLRLMWRYMELNDKATLHYYRVSTNAEMHVRFRKGPVAPYPAPVAHDHADNNGAAAPADLARIPRRSFNDAVRVGVPPSTVPPDAVVPLDVWQQQAAQERARREQDAVDQRRLWQPYSSPTQSAVLSSSSAAVLPTRSVVCDVRDGAQPTAPADTRTGHAVVPLPAAAPYIPSSAPQATHASELQVLSDSTNATVVEVSALRRHTQWITTQLEVLKQQYGAQQAQLQTSTALRRELEQRSTQRIAELEASMHHFQQYLERALRLMAEGPPR